jgi:hypothetical protein
VESTAAEECIQVLIGAGANHKVKDRRGRDAVARANAVSQVLARRLRGLARHRNVDAGIAAAMTKWNHTPHQASSSAAILGVHGATRETLKFDGHGGLAGSMQALGERVRAKLYRLGVDTGLDAEGPFEGLAHPEAWLLRSLVFAEEMARAPGLVDLEDMGEALQKYVMCTANDPVSPLLLLSYARLANCRGDASATLGLLRAFQERSPKLSTHWLTEAETALLKGAGDQDLDDDEVDEGEGEDGQTPVSPLDQRWAVLQTLLTEPQRKPMEELMAMVGLRVVKEQARDQQRPTTPSPSRTKLSRHRHQDHYHHHQHHCHIMTATTTTPFPGHGHLRERAQR